MTTMIDTPTTDFSIEIFIPDSAQELLAEIDGGVPIVGRVYGQTLKRWNRHPIYGPDCWTSLVPKPAVGFTSNAKFVWRPVGIDIIFDLFEFDVPILGLIRKRERCPELRGRKIYDHDNILFNLALTFY